MKRSTCFALVSVLLGACAPEGDGGDDEGYGESEAAVSRPSVAEARACAEGGVGNDANGDPVLKCTKPFAERPFVRLPTDSAQGDTTTFYAGVTVPTTASNEFVLWTREGQRFVPVDARAKAISFRDSAKLPRGLRAPTNRATFTLYQFKGKIGRSVDSPFGPARAIRLESARAVVSIDGCAFDSRLLGTWEGSASQRLTSPAGPGGPFARAFDESKRVPIRVVFDKIAPMNKLAEFEGGQQIEDAATYKLTGRIENFDRTVTVNGRVFPSLEAMGERSPFFGADDGKVELYRLGNMHGQSNDGHWVFTYPLGAEPLTFNGMSHTLTSQTAPTLLLPDEHRKPLETIEIFPHMPYGVNGHSVLLEPVAIGARTGQCR